MPGECESHEKVRQVRDIMGDGFDEGFVVAMLNAMDECVERVIVALLEENIPRSLAPVYTNSSSNIAKCPILLILMVTSTCSHICLCRVGTFACVVAASRKLWRPQRSAQYVALLPHRCCEHVRVPLSISPSLPSSLPPSIPPPIPPCLC